MRCRAGCAVTTDRSDSLRGRTGRRDALTGLAAVAPALAILLAFSIIPLVYVTTASFRTRDGDAWTLAHYRKCLAGAPVGQGRAPFTRALGNTVYYALGTAPVSIVLGLAVAALLSGDLRGKAAYRMIYFLPFTTSSVAAAAAWRWIFHREPWGIANAVLARWGAPPLAWTEESTGIFDLVARYFGRVEPLAVGGPSLALVTCMVFAIWHALGFNVIIFLAGLSRIPRELYEAARMDGAGAWRSFWHVTVPLLGPTTFFLSVIMTIASFQAMTHIFIMTPAEWDRSAQNVTLFIFEQVWQQHDYRCAAAAATLLFVIILGLTLVQFLVVGKRVHYR